MFISSLGPIPSEGPSEEVKISGEARARWSLGLSKASFGSSARPERDGIHKPGLRGSLSTQITVSTRILEERPSSGAGGLLVRLGPLTSMEKVRGDISWAGEGARLAFSVSSALHSIHRGGVSRHRRGRPPAAPPLFNAHRLSSCLQALSADRCWWGSQGELADSLWHRDTLSGVLRSLFGAGPRGHPPPRISLYFSANILLAGSERWGAREGAGESRRTLSGTAVLSREYHSRSSERALAGIRHPASPCTPQRTSCLQALSVGEPGREPERVGGLSPVL